MRKFFMLLLLPLQVLAHPGIGIVKDSKGNIFYTDLKHVWKIDSNGTKTIAVHNVHTHELFIDENDNLFGEHLWYNGERLDTWGHYAWCLKADGVLDTAVKPSEGFLTNYSFVRDGEGNMYWVERFKVSRFKKKAKDGTITTIAEGKFENIRWSHCTKAGVLYFVDLHKLYKLTPDGKFTLLASNLDNGKLSFGFSRQHNVYGIWTDVRDNIYVAVMSGRMVKKISPEGQVEIIAYSLTPWSPTGGLFDNAGNLWLLENSLTNEVRVRKISAEKLLDKPDKAKAVVFNYGLPITLAAGIVGLIGLGMHKIMKSLRNKSKKEI